MSDNQFQSSFSSLPQIKEGELSLQVCHDCKAVNYPERERCRTCLSQSLQWDSVSGAGEVLSITSLHHSNEQLFNARLPINMVSVQLDCGPVVLAFVQGDKVGIGHKVHVGVLSDSAGNRVLVACNNDIDLANINELEKIKSQLRFLEVDQ